MGMGVFGNAPRVIVNYTKHARVQKRNEITDQVCGGFVDRPAPRFPPREGSTVFFETTLLCANCLRWRARAVRCPDPARWRDVAVPGDRGTYFAVHGMEFEEENDS